MVPKNRQTRLSKKKEQQKSKLSGLLYPPQHKLQIERRELDLNSLWKKLF